MDVSSLDYELYEKFISKERRIKTNNFHFKKDKKLSYGSELLLRYGLSKLNINNPKFSKNSYGKPYLINSKDVFFNISHSDNFVICAISTKEVGVDIEKIKDIDLDIARKFFFKDEYELILKSNNKIDDFYKLWTLKESFMKFTSKGFNLNLNDFSVYDGENFNVIFKENNCKDLKLNSFNFNNYKIATCSYDDNLKLTRIDLDLINDFLSI
ncbi:4'-phosphopantetheinyl transferase family protein [Methanobrevibacter sp. DSM 116169]|uniref:4'-phosphopantetheinyl transferase family protein n=1 Tax=Methanobrevibacter sp. DSM 116169 TaxID=3242727 RepID=UPI0038FD1740